MAISKSKFIKSFLAELAEQIHATEEAMLSLKNDPDNNDYMAIILRSLHTIKGSSRMLQFDNIEKLSHTLESVFKGIKDGRYKLTSPIIQFVLKTFDFIRDSYVEIESSGHDTINSTNLILEIGEKICSVEPFDISLLSESINEAVKEPKLDLAPKSIETTATQKKAEPARTEKIRMDNNLRISSDSIDKAIQSVTTLSVKQLRLWKSSDDLKQLDAKLKHMALNTSEPYIAELIHILKPIRTRYEEHLSEVNSSTDEVREQLIDMRMLPLEGMLEHIPRMVEENALALGKNVVVKISNSGVRLDRIVLEKIQDPLIHLVRNAVDHGIENTEERVKAGKPEKATITINCYTEGNKANIIISDDGKGFNYNKIRQKAQKLYPDMSEEIANMPESELSAFVFMSGFSTKDEVTAISGRGVGLDIVKVNIESIKGKITVESTPKVGSTFTLVMPLSIATIDGMFVTADANKYFIPSSYISETVRVNHSECFMLMNRKMYGLRETNIPLYELSSALRLEAKDKKDKYDHVLVVKIMGETIGIVVDRIVDYTSLVFRPLPKALNNHTVVQGIVFDENYNIIPILNVQGLFDQLKKQKNIDSLKRFVMTEKKEKKILIVDDSRNTREIETAMLELEGYTVTAAQDGLEALDFLSKSRYDLILTDINMPRMDGLTLLENLKRDADYSKIPVILISTADEPENRARANALGADGFIRKASFDQDNLIEAVYRLIGGVEK